MHYKIQNNIIRSPIGMLVIAYSFHSGDDTGIVVNDTLDTFENVRFFFLPTDRTQEMAGMPRYLHGNCVISQLKYIIDTFDLFKYSKPEETKYVLNKILDHQLSSKLGAMKIN
jgi:hypothetical protein